MAAKSRGIIITDCDRKAMEQFLCSVKFTVKEMKEFNARFMEFLEQQKKLSKDLCNWVTRYNILNAGPPCVYPIIQKEELMEEMLVKIQEKTSAIHQSLNEMKQKYENLSIWQKVLEKQSLTLNWDPTENPQIKGSIKHRPPTEYLEDIADIVFKFDVSITCMFQYFEALNLHHVKSYEHLANSFSISSEIVDFVNEFLIKNITLVN